MSVGRSGGHEPLFAAFVGIDWADQKHVWSLQTADSQKRESGELEHAPEAVEGWVAQLSQRFAQRPIAVAIEQSRGLWCMCSASMSVCIFSRFLRRWPAICETLCIHPAPRMIPGMPTCSWIYCCSIATNCAVY